MSGISIGCTRLGLFALDALLLVRGQRLARAADPPLVRGLVVSAAGYDAVVGRQESDLMTARTRQCLSHGGDGDTTKALS